MDQPVVGKVTWFDLPVPDASDAMAFYEALFGWRFARMKNDAVPDYLLIESDGVYIGGLRGTGGRSLAPSDAATPVPYVTVERLGPALNRARELGGRLEGPLVNLGEGRGAYQWIRDRAGNVIGLWAASK